MKKLLIFFLFGLVGISGFCQGDVITNIIPSSPEASSLSRFATIPVNHSNGTVGVQIPLTSLKIKDLNIPVSIRYNTSGIKVQDIASQVGLGWSLDAGGVISRTVRGIADELNDGYIGDNSHVDFLYSNSDEDICSSYGCAEDLHKIASNDWDGEPDFFTAHFLGRDVRFVFSKTGEAYTLPYSRFKIIPSISNEVLEGFTVMDEAGNEFVFGMSSSYREKTTQHIQGEEETTTAITSWFLNYIITAGGEKVTFSYVAGSDVKYDLFNYMVKEVYNWSDGCSGDKSSTEEKDKTNHITIRAPKYISSIASRYGSINFESDFNREDLPNARILKSITLKNVNGSIVSKYDLFYNYFTSDPYISLKPELSKRLKLTHIIDNTHVGNKLSSYRFTYEEGVKLAPRNSLSYDHWGYHTVPTTSKVYIPKVAEVKFEDGTGYFGYYRKSHPDYVSAGILTKIEYPTGGSDEFSYEINQYYENGIKQYAGGLRVAKQIKNYSNNKKLTTTYSYNQSGTIYSIPKYYFKYSTPGGSCVLDYINRYSQSLAELFDLNGYHISYSHVTESVTGMGRTEYYYTDFTSNGDTPPRQFYYAQQMISTQAGPYIVRSGLKASSPDEYPYSPNTSYAWERGLLLKKEIYNEKGDILTKVTNQYNIQTSVMAKVRALKASFIWYDPDSYLWCYMYGRYDVISRSLFLGSVTQETYDKNLRKLKNVTDYTYDDATNQISMISEYNPVMDSKIVTKLKYPTDASYAGGAVTGQEGETISSMASKNMLSSVIEETKWLEHNGQKQLLKGTVITYKPQLISSIGKNVYVPDKVYMNRSGVTENVFEASYVNQTTGKLIIDSRYQQKEQYLSYNNFGNLLEYQSNIDNTRTTYEWNSDNTLAIKSIRNPGTNELEYQYQYKPLIGLTKQTDANGIATQYDYDNMNRLKLIKDNKGNILKRFTYNYQNSQLQAFLTTVGPNKVGVNVKFIADGVGTNSGKSKYIWDFGDGTVMETFNSEQYHAYASGGTYKIKLLIENPEYDDVKEINRVYQVYTEDFTISVCSNILQKDLCSGDVVPGNCLTPLSSGPDDIVVSVNFNGGARCEGPFTYSWQYTRDSGLPIDLKTNDSKVIFPMPSVIGTYTFFCTVKDSCGTTYTASTEVKIISTGLNCGLSTAN